MDDTRGQLWAQFLVPLCPCRGQSSSSGRPHGYRCPVETKIRDLGQSIGNKGVKTSAQNPELESGSRDKDRVQSWIKVTAIIFQGR